MWCHFQGVISTEENIIVYCRQIFDALVYLHERYVCNDLLLLEGVPIIVISDCILHHVKFSCNNDLGEAC